MAERLPPRIGERIDRQRPLTFSFEGRSYTGYQGDTLVSALWASGARVLGRSFKYHRPRGVFSLAGHDVNVMVEDATRTNLRGDTLLLEDGLDVRAVNTQGGVEHDRLAVVERFSQMLPVGFYYKAFHTPRQLFPLYEQQMREVAGLGAIRREQRFSFTPKDYDFCDVVVVGGGPAGLAAAIAAGERGLDVLLVDDQPALGGSLTWQHAREEEAQARHDELQTRIDFLDNVRVRTGTWVGGCYSDLWFALFDAERMTKLRAQAVIFATGCVEQPAVFQNNDLPGVMLASAAQRLIHWYAVKPFQRGVLLTANEDGYRAALDLHDAGVSVAAVVDLRPSGETGPLGIAVRAAKLPVFTGATVYEARTQYQAVSAAVICPLNPQGQPRVESATTIACDGVAVSVGWAPNVGLAYQAGARFAYSEATHQLTPKRRPDNVFLAGRARGAYALPAQIEDGRCAGLAAAQCLGRYDEPLPAPPPTAEPFSHPYPIFAHPGKKNFVDLDEDLHLSDFAHAHQEGYDNIELLKRYTTVGMGPSQGKTANMNAVRILARLNRESIDQTGTTTSRPFYQPAPLSHLAGRRFHPQRETPLHAWHCEAGAVGMHAGAWLRPEYYAEANRPREDCILEEAVQIRESVGLIDVSTLGKIVVQGRDAAEFLERIYTGRFRKQPLGRLRYGLACDETGVIIEDGVIARLDEHRFYLTATSSGAGAFFQELQRWVLRMGLRVQLINLTGQWAAMNLAGPQARAVLQRLTDVDLAPQAFPYLGVRSGEIAGAPATLLRVGFVGECGYELHVPADQALHVWRTLIDAGRGRGLRPFGVEAQRLLRLEKGHLIVGQDTDALTNPFEAGLQWALARKPFFVGERALRVASQRPLHRTLVGVRFDSKLRPEQLPEECNLIIHRGEIAGRITSIAHRSTLGYPLGLAFVRPDLAAPGTKLRVRCDNGRMTPMGVVETPFYDPSNRRQQAGV